MCTVYGSRKRCNAFYCITDFCVVCNVCLLRKKMILLHCRCFFARLHNDVYQKVTYSSFFVQQTRPIFAPLWCTTSCQQVSNGARRGFKSFTPDAPGRKTLISKSSSVKMSAISRHLDNGTVYFRWHSAGDREQWEHHSRWSPPKIVYLRIENRSEACLNQLFLFNNNIIVSL